MAYLSGKHIGKTRAGDLVLSDPFGKILIQFKTILDHIGPFCLFGPVSLTRLFAPVYLDLSIYTNLFGPVSLDPCIWTHLIGPVYFDQYI